MIFKKFCQTDHQFFVCMTKKTESQVLELMLSINFNLRARKANSFQQRETSWKIISNNTKKSRILALWSVWQLSGVFWRCRNGFCARSLTLLPHGVASRDSYEWARRAHKNSLIVSFSSCSATTEVSRDDVCQGWIKSPARDSLEWRKQSQKKYKFENKRERNSRGTRDCCSVESCEQKNTENAGSCQEIFSLNAANCESTETTSRKKKSENLMPLGPSFLRVLVVEWKFILYSTRSCCLCTFFVFWCWLNARENTQQHRERKRDWRFTLRDERARRRSEKMLNCKYIRGTSASISPDLCPTNPRLSSVFRPTIIINICTIIITCEFFSYNLSHPPPPSQLSTLIYIFSVLKSSCWCVFHVVCEECM